MDAIEIKRATQLDVSELQKIGMQTFLEAFSTDNSVENMTQYMNASFSLDKLNEELANPNSEFYFAMVDNRVIGYLKVNSGSSQTELQDEQALEIERIYAFKEFHGKKVGKKLYDKALQIALQRKSPYIWLGVWEKNFRAIAFYKKNGFVEFDKHIFKLGDDLQTDIMMKLPLH